MFTLTRTEINTKAAKYHYVVTDENGTVISERKSNREYVACTSDGRFYFGRMDLVGKGDHGRAIQHANGWGLDFSKRDRKGNYRFLPNMKEPNQALLQQLTAVAYLHQ